MEDGTETNNYITGNLGVFIRRSSALLKSDQKPGIYWTATPTNFWRDNVAIHSTAFGFWFELAANTDEGFCPQGETLGEFYNMTFSQNNGIGLRIYPNWVPVKNPCQGNSNPNPQYLYNLLSYRNNGNGMFGKHHGSIHHINAIFIENSGHDISIVHLDNVNYDQNPIFQNTLFIGSLNPDFQENTNLYKYGIYGPQSEYFYVKDSIFLNYGNSGAITGCNECLVGSEMNQGGFTTRYENITFINTILRLVWSETKKEIIWDIDGSITGIPDSMITRAYNYLHYIPECTLLLPETVYSDSITCGNKNSSIRIRRMQIDNVSPSQLSYTDIRIFTTVGNSEFYFLPLDTYGWVFPVITGNNHTYRLEWTDSGISAYTLRYTYSREAYLLESVRSNTSKWDERVQLDYRPNK